MIQKPLLLPYTQAAETPNQKKVDVTFFPVLLLPYTQAAETPNQKKVDVTFFPVNGQSWVNNGSNFGDNNNGW